MNPLEEIMKEKIDELELRRGTVNSGEGFVSVDLHQMLMDAEWVAWMLPYGIVDVERDGVKHREIRR